MYPHRIVTFSKFMLERNDSPGGQQVDTAPKPQPQRPELTEAQKKIFESVESIQKTIETQKAGAKIVGERASVLGAGLERIKKDLVPGTSVDDIEYKQLLQTYNRLVKEYQDIARQQSQTSQILDTYVSQLDGQTKAYIEKETPQSEKPKETQPQSTELTKEEQEKIDAEIKAESDKIAEKPEFNFNKDAFYKAVKEANITYNPKIDKKVVEGENTTKEEAIAEIQEMAKAQKDNPDMKIAPKDAEQEKKNLSQDQQALKALGESLGIQKIQSEIDDLTKQSEHLMRLMGQETDANKKKELEVKNQEILKQIETKNKELDSKKTPEYKGLEKKIEEGQNKIDQAIAAEYKRNPQAYASRLARETAKSGPNNVVAFVINEVFKKVFGIDLYATSNGGTTPGNDFDNSNLIGGSASTELGSLSEQFESGGKGPYEITPNDDNQGFPSYGTYQFNRDTLQQFATHMKIAGDCRQVGNDTPFAQAWKKKIEEVGVQKFKEEERAFAKKIYFEPQMKKIQSSGIDTSKFSLTMQNVVWSSAIQHGQNTDLVVKALENYRGKPWTQEIEKEAIGKIYDARLVAWPEGTKRYSQERKIALAQLTTLAGGVSNVPAGDIQSLPASRNPITGVTQCLGTARANLARFGISVPGNASAAGLESVFRAQGKLDSSVKMEQGKDGTFMLFTNSLKWNGQDAAHPKYGHAVAGYVKGGHAYILDPYLPAFNGQRTTKAIPYDVYVSYLKSSGRGLNGIANFG